MAATDRVRKWFWPALPFVIGLLVILAVLVAGITNEWVLVTVDDKYIRYYNPSIAIDAQENRHILVGHGDGTALDRGISYLKVDGRDIVERVLDDARSLDDGSILLDSSGIPHFLYTTYVNYSLPQSLMYAVIENESLELQIVDSNVHGQCIDIAVDSSNTPHIVYMDLTDVIYARLTGGVWLKQNISSVISSYWPVSTLYFNIDVAISVDSQDVPHIAALVGSGIVCCDLLPNSSWRSTRWSMSDLAGYEIDIASDSKGSTYVVFQAPIPNSSTHSQGIFLGTLTGDGLWSYRPYIDFSSLGDIKNYGRIRLAIDENDGLVVCCSYGYPSRLFYQIDSPGSAANGTVGDSEGRFWSFDMGVGRDGHIFLVAGSYSVSFLMLTNSASFGDRVNDLDYGSFLEVVAGMSIAVGTVNGCLRWRENRNRQGS